MDSREHSVEIREFKEYGLDKTAIKFNSLKLLEEEHDRIPILYCPMCGRRLPKWS